MKKMAVVFGAEVLIKHTLSAEYISIKEHDCTPALTQKSPSLTSRKRRTPLATSSSSPPAASSPTGMPSLSDLSSKSSMSKGNCL